MIWICTASCVNKVYIGTYQSFINTTHSTDQQAGGKLQSKRYLTRPACISLETGVALVLCLRGRSKNVGHDWPVAQEFNSLRLACY